MLAGDLFKMSANGAHFFNSISNTHAQGKPALPVFENQSYRTMGVLQCCGTILVPVFSCEERPLAAKVRLLVLLLVSSWGLSLFANTTLSVLHGGSGYTNVDLIGRLLD